MSVYFQSIFTAFATFLVLAFALTVPFLIYQYRKYNYINKFRALILYSFLYYCLVAFYLIILPLPPTRDTCSWIPAGRQFYQLVPFNFIKDIIKETSVVLSNPATYLRILKEPAFLQAFFNAILLLPMGIYLRYYFKRNLKQTVVICFLISLFFEVTQLTGIYGIYNCPYRLFDVDDLMLNTLGGYLGYLITPVFSYLMPRQKLLDKEINEDIIRVGYIRRALALSVDWFILDIVLHYFGDKQNILANAMVVFLYFIVLPYATNGKTLGKSLVRIRIKGTEEKLKFKEVLIRYSILYYGVFGYMNFATQSYLINTNPYIQAGFVILLMLALPVLGIHLILQMIRKDILFYEKISKTRNVVISKGKKISQ